MSSTAEEKTEEVGVCCANCGIAPMDDIKLKICCDGGCDLVKYCSDVCRENHREQHEEDCNQRKAELHDKELFEQPEETCYGECPICFLPIPLDQSKSRFNSCCCKLVCEGCCYADYKSREKVTLRGITIKQLNISKRQLDWEILWRIIV